MTAELLRLAARMPMIPAQRRMALGPLVEARNACPERPPWSAIFTKGYALVARETPFLRQAYLRLPLPHIHEYPHSSAAIAVERIVDGESVIGPLLVNDPASLGIGTIGRMIRRAKTADIYSVDSFRQALGIAALPWPVRPLALRLGYNMAAARADFFGTFGVSVIASDGAELLSFVSPLPMVLTYGLFAPDGSIDVRIVFDHRIVDAAPVARALVRLEQVLNGPVTEEVLRLAEAPVEDRRG
jgi:hypothetical protein